MSTLRFELSAPVASALPAESGTEIAIVGRSNAGKSSALNAIFSRGLARVSGAPGRTRAVNCYCFADGARMFDLPGYGYAAAPKKMRASWRPLSEACLSRPSVRAIILVVDCRRGLGEMDCRLLEWLAPMKKSVHILLAKSDKLNRAESLRVLESSAQKAQECMAEKAAKKGGKAKEGGSVKKSDIAVTVQLFSALKKAGVVEAREKIQSLLAS